MHKTRILAALAFAAAVLLPGLAQAKSPDAQVERSIDRITGQAKKDADKETRAKANPCKGLKADATAAQVKACKDFKAKKK